MSPDPPATAFTPKATAFTQMVGCRLPVVQTGMGWVSGASLTAATSAAGGFGIVAGATLDREQLQHVMARIRDRTDAPFGVNLRPDQADLAARLDDIVASGVGLVSFAGPPDRDTIARLHDAGLLVMVTVGAPRHAEKMAGLGVDVLIAQGTEGGGHTGSIPTALLVPVVIDAAGAVPVLAAGGMRNGRDLVHQMQLGAAGIAMGTRFLLTAESRVPAAVKQRYLVAGLNDTVVTSALDGAPQRVVRTEYVARLERRSLPRRMMSAALAAMRFSRVSGTSWRALATEGFAMRRTQELSWLQVALSATTPTLTRAALVDGDLDAGVLPSGQIVGVIDDLPAVAELIASIEADARVHAGTQMGPT
ncbi:MAG TPA: nitronate monooxygenase [Ilumatobacter sp.]|nr:nitronate monooxygenase [Ilumatobacter sp.]